MTFTFIDMAGKTLFTRDDAERAEWTHEEMSIELEFPYLSNKHISTGQRIFFIDPRGNHQIFEVKQAKTTQPEGYQTVVAEHICISELSDEHKDNVEVTDKTAKKALESVLDGTLWSVGSSEINPTSSGDLSRGSVWQMVLEITDNWNVYIVPRVTLSSNGTITRKLDIKSPDGAWNGLRLSIDKNMLDPSVTYDDSEVYTALYGYGGTLPSSKPGEEGKEVTFADVVWSKTSEHPAKPKGQVYIEDPTATASYGRNGRARFGFYQNTDIDDPEVLLQKTWESLQQSSKPDISIDGTVEDLYRMGYADQPIALHDIALVEVSPSGFKQQIQIIRMTEDLLDPSATTLTIGSYIPNIIYINRKTDENATGGRGGGGKNTSEETTWREFRTTIQANQDGTGLQIRSVQNDLNNTKEEVAVQIGEISVAYDNISIAVSDLRDETSEMSGKIDVNSDKISLVVTETSHGNVVNAASIVAGINGGSSYIKLSADHIDIDGLVTKLEAISVGVGSLKVEGKSDFYGTVYCESTVYTDGNVECGAKVYAENGFETGSYTATWQSFSFTDIVQWGGYHYFLYAGDSQSPTPTGSFYGRLPNTVQSKTIYYLGRS